MNINRSINQIIGLIFIGGFLFLTIITSFNSTTEGVIFLCCTIMICIYEHTIIEVL